MNNHKMSEIQPKQKIRRRISNDVNFHDQAAYRLFIKETGRKDIPYELFKQIPISLSEKIIQKVYTRSYLIRIPKLGSYRLIKVKPYVKLRNYAVSDKKAILRNTHTGGYIYKLQMYLHESRNINMGMFRFFPSRKHKRNLAKLILSNKVK